MDRTEKAGIAAGLCLFPKELRPSAPPREGGIHKPMDGKAAG